jgi:hypothetical protein
MPTGSKKVRKLVQGGFKPIPIFWGKYTKYLKIAIKRGAKNVKKPIFK